MQVPLSLREAATLRGRQESDMDFELSFKVLEQLETSVTKILTSVVACVCGISALCCCLIEWHSGCLFIVLNCLHLYSGS
jgi:hypothetical protein